MWRRSGESLHPAQFGHGQKALVRVRASGDQRAGFFDEIASGLAVLAGGVGCQVEHGRSPGKGGGRSPRWSFLGEVRGEEFSDAFAGFFLVGHFVVLSVDTRQIPTGYPLVNPVGIIYFRTMSKDPHLKRQKQIRMDDELRARFDAAQKASGLPADEFVSRCLDALEHRNQPTNKELLDMLKERLK